MSPRKKYLGQTLINAVLRDDLIGIQQALADGAEVDARDLEHQETPLMLTRSDAAARLLLDHGADVHARDNKGTTAFIATRRLILVQRGADVNAQDDNGKTALMQVVEVARIDEVQQVLALGADVNLQNQDGQTALSLADAYGFRAIAECLRAAEADGSHPK